MYVLNGKEESEIITHKNESLFQAFLEYKEALFIHVFGPYCFKPHCNGKLLKLTI